MASIPWVSQRESAPSRVAWVIGGMSLRTQEAARAARTNTEPNFNRADIVIEDLQYAITGKQPVVFDEIVRRLINAGIGIEMEAHGSHVVVCVQVAGENWTRATIETTDELAHWASDRFEEVKANPSPPAVRIFADHSAAFDYCRECNSPVRVVINGFWWKLFPSGRAYEQERFTA